MGRKRDLKPAAPVLRQARMVHPSPAGFAWGAFAMGVAQGTQHTSALRAAGDAAGYAGTGALVWAIGRQVARGANPVRAGIAAGIKTSGAIAMAGGGGVVAGAGIKQGAEGAGSLALARKAAEDVAAALSAIKDEIGPQREAGKPGRHDPGLGAGMVDAYVRVRNGIAEFVSGYRSGRTGGQF